MVVIFLVFIRTDFYEIFRNVHIPATEKFWHKEQNCHEIYKTYTEALLGRPISDYSTRNIFSRLFSRIPSVKLIEPETDPK